MEYITLGNSKLEISNIAFGAWAIGGWMWGGSDEKDAINAIEKSFELGITTIDTAPIYGFGKSEEIVGKATRDKRDKFQILTKYGMSWEGNKGEFFFPTQNNDNKPVDIYKYSGKENVIKECEVSLKRLQTDYIDLYQIHWPDNTTAISETMEAIEILLQQGKIRAAGVSNFSKELLADIPDGVIIASNQVPYSMVNRNIEKELVPFCIEKNIGILAYSPLQRGILTGKIKHGQQFNEGDTRPNTPYYKEKNINSINLFLQKIKPIADKHNATLAQLVLNWTAHRPGISCVLAGARNAKQIEDNAMAMNFKISDEDLKIINSELNMLKLEV